MWCDGYNDDGGDAGMDSPRLHRTLVYDSFPVVTSLQFGSSSLFVVSVTSLVDIFCILGNVHDMAFIVLLNPICFFFFLSAEARQQPRGGCRTVPESPR